MTKLSRWGHHAAGSLLVPSLVLLALAAALLAVAVFPADGLAADEGEGGPPAPAVELAFPQSPLELPKTTLGTESSAVTVTVHNAGTVAGAIDTVALDGPDAGEFKLNGTNCGWLEPGQDCAAWISFMPGSSGAREAVLTVKPKEQPVATLPISGTGVVSQLSIGPGSHDFGIQRVNRGEGSTQFQIANSGEAMTVLTSIGIGGPNQNNFWTNGGDCWNGRQLQPGESCTVGVGFNPWETVAYEAQLQVQASGGASFDAGLQGTGGRAQLEPDSMPSELGAVTVGSGGAVETIAFVNHGNLAGSFFIGIVAGGDSGSFRLLDESCSAAPVPPGAGCVAHVRFEPQSAGPKLARLALFGDDDGGTGALLSGTGVAPALTLAPASFDFGTVAAGERSEPRDFAIRNNGSTALVLDRVAIVGADVDQFALASDECTDAALAPGAECVVRVGFAPGEAGAKAAKLRVSGPGGAFVASLSGTASERALEETGEVPGGGQDASDQRSGGQPSRRRGSQRFARREGIAGASRVRHRTALRGRMVPR